MRIKYVHTNVVAQDWELLANFYIQVFGCQPQPPKRDQKGAWLDKGTGQENFHLQGMHLLLPGYGEEGPTLEIYQYNTIENHSPKVNRRGLGHLAFHVEDVHEMYEKVLLYGGRKVGSIVARSIPEIGTLTFVYMADPEGNIIEIQNWS